MDPFVDRLRELCRTHPTRGKWVFVVSHAIGRTIGDRIAREGTGWANVRFVTPLDVALRMGAPFLVEQGIDPSEEGLGPALIMRLLLALPAAGGYFRPLASQPQLAVALWSTVRELRMAGVRADDLPASAFGNPRKHRELVALVRSFERYLLEHRRGDAATVFEEATRHLDWCPIDPRDCWIAQPDVRWSPLEQRLIDVMPGEQISLEPRASTPGSVPSSAAPPSSGPAPRASSHFFHAGGADAEVEEVFRRVLRTGTRLDDVEIVCANPAYAPLVWEKAVRFGWPVTTSRGMPVTLTRPGRALLALADWIEDDFAAGRLRRLLQSGDVWLDASVGASPARAARMLVQAQAAWGRDTFRLAFARLAAASRRRAAADDVPDDQRDALLARAADAEAIGAWIDGLVRSVPSPDADGTVAIADVARCASGFVAACAPRASALDRLAAAALVQAIDDLQALGDFRCPLGHALRMIDERVRTLVVGADRPRPGQLFVSTLATAGYAGRAAVFVVGLEEGRVFPAPFEDPVLLDAERQAIGHGLQRSDERIDEAVRTALGRLSILTSQTGAAITFSYSCRDLREYRHTYASWVLLRAWRDAIGAPGAGYADLHAALGEPVSCVPPDEGPALDPSRWWLRAATTAGDAARPALLDRYHDLAWGATAGAARASDRFTVYDGDVPAAGPVLDPCRDDVVISPTQLEDAASCPFRHFLRRGLGVNAIESGDRDRDVWLDPLLRGSLLHDLYAALLRRCRNEGRRVSADVDAEWLIARGRATLADLSAEMPPPSAEVGDRETRLFLEDLGLFVDGEAGLDTDRRPVGLEVGFGRAASAHARGGSDDDDEPLAQSDPVVLDLGRGLRVKLAGRIDRIDQIGPDTFEILDYKTGGYWPDDWQGTFAGGTRLQHALYGLGAAEVLRRRKRAGVVAGAQYYFSSAKGHQERKRIVSQPAARVAEVVSDLRAVIVGGLFVHASEERACRWCDYGHACGARAAERAAAKKADERLAPVVRLGAHE